MSICIFGCGGDASSGASKNARDISNQKKQSLSSQQLAELKKLFEDLGLAWPGDDTDPSVLLEMISGELKPVVGEQESDDMKRGR
jgi:hypothetical protein